MTHVEEGENRYLLFTVAGELFGTPLLDVREVVEVQKPKPIPNTSKSYLGVINIRGEIVGAIDLRLRFGFEPTASKHAAMMVFDTADGTVAALADGMEGVVEILRSSISENLKIESRISTDYILGIGKTKNKMVALIDLKRVITDEESQNLNNARSVA